MPGGHGDVGFRELWDHPDDYRGALLELRGFCRRVDSSESKLGAAGKLHEVWITLPEGELTPFACIAEKLPEGFPNNVASSEPVVFLSYFLKVMAYNSGAGRRGAPLLIGKLERVAGDKNADPLDQEQAQRLPKGTGTSLVVPREEERFVISVDKNEAVAIEDEPIARKDLAGKLTHLAAQVRQSARALGTPLDAKGELPAVIVIRPDDETRCSTVFSLVLDCRQSGFARFALKPARPHPAAARLAETKVAPPDRNKDNDLPTPLRTIPIVLGADNRGRIAQAEVGELARWGYDSLEAELTSIINDPDLAFDQARITADPRLMCSELGRVMELLAKRNISVTEIRSLAPG